MLTANVFALMGLRQLYFLIGGLLKRLVYLSYGLAFLLLFIGVKLILHAMHENELPFVNGGEHVGWAPEIPIWLSLLVILGTLVVTAVASLASDKSQARRRGGLSDGSGASLPAGHRSDGLPRLAAGPAAARRRSPHPRADPRRGQAADREWRDRVEVVEGDASSYDDLRRALDGVDAGYYLLHSMDGRPGFERARPGDGLDVRPRGRGRGRRPDRLHVRSPPRRGGAQRPPGLAGRGRGHLPALGGARRGAAGRGDRGAGLRVVRDAAPPHPPAAGDARAQVVGQPDPADRGQRRAALPRRGPGPAPRTPTGPSTSAVRTC